MIGPRSSSTERELGRGTDYFSVTTTEPETEGGDDLDRAVADMRSAVVADVGLGPRWPQIAAGAVESFVHEAGGPRSRAVQAVWDALRAVLAVQRFAANVPEAASGHAAHMALTEAGDIYLNHGLFQDPADAPTQAAARGYVPAVDARPEAVAELKAARDSYHKVPQEPAETMAPGAASDDVAEVAAGPAVAALLEAARASFRMVVPEHAATMAPGAASDDVPEVAEWPAVTVGLTAARYSYHKAPQEPARDAAGLTAVLDGPVWPPPSARLPRPATARRAREPGGAAAVAFLRLNGPRRRRLRRWSAEAMPALASITPPPTVAPRRAAGPPEGQVAPSPVLGVEKRPGSMAASLETAAASIVEVRGRGSCLWRALAVACGGPEGDWKRQKSLVLAGLSWLREEIEAELEARTGGSWETYCRRQGRASAWGDAWTSMGWTAAAGMTLVVCRGPLPAVAYFNKEPGAPVVVLHLRQGHYAAGANWESALWEGRPAATALEAAGGSEAQRRLDNVAHLRSRFELADARSGGGHRHGPGVELDELRGGAWTEPPPQMGTGSHTARHPGAGAPPRDGDSRRGEARGSRRGPTGSGRLGWVIEAVNASCWTTLKGRLVDTNAHIVLAQEVRLDGDRLADGLRWARAHGWRAVMPACLRAVVGPSAGVAVFARAAIGNRGRRAACGAGRPSRGGANSRRRQRGHACRLGVPAARHRDHRPQRSDPHPPGPFPELRGSAVGGGRGLECTACRAQ